MTIRLNKEKQSPVTEFTQIADKLHYKFLSIQSTKYIYVTHILCQTYWITTEVIGYGFLFKF